ncbi:WhiB family transcriptional regulator [Streptomyces formicae]|uniref:Transcriptional regulator WhiB n=1 Tax=Streptomyces formicae TaxID=1616117 RepID=A0ABY3WWI6_9ACTN|nr:WhiB family transcriptional regulator [Streptomyces formicae]
MYDPERRWLDRASCRTVHPERFFAPNGSQLDRAPAEITQKIWDDAKKICHHCPVLEQCRRDTRGEEYGVWGGLDEHERYQARKRLTRGAWKKWPEELQLQWGKHLARLRQGELTWHQIKLRTGLPVSVSEALIRRWEAHQAQQVGQVAEVVDLPLPEPPKILKDFPATPGQRHGWVRNNGLIADGWYAGHTEDGAWVRMQVFSGRGNVIKFFRAKDVRFYNPQPRWTVPYHGRPDADDVSEDAHVA